MVSNRKIIRGYGSNGESLGQATENVYLARKNAKMAEFIRNNSFMQPGQAALKFEEIWEAEDGFKER